MIQNQIIVATSNQGKMREIRKIFEGTGVELISLKEAGWTEEIIESGATFAENAEIKARTVFEKYRSPVLAEDSGLVVESLGGEPGIYSARYAGEESNDKKNNEKLLLKVKDFDGKISAAFVCSVVFIDGERILRAEGRINGRIIKAPRGTNGFGYDPLFVPDGYEQTTAELDPEVKNRISHRGKAIKKLKTMIFNEQDKRDKN